MGDLIGHTALLGYETSHPKTINAESDGVIIAMRILDYLTIERPYLKNRMMGRVAEVYAGQLMGREEIKKTHEQF